MSEEVTEAPKKKGKLPVIIIMLVVLLGGGFFGLKMKGGGEKKKPEIKLGEMHEIEEFLVNLSNPTDYLHLKLSLQTAEGFKKEEIEKNMAALRDAVLAVLASKRITEVNTEDGKVLLKRELAERLNQVLKMLDKSKTSKKPEAPAKVEKGKKLVHPEWDSDTGPVLKIYFTDFTTQQG